jgi:hypothetical protein
VKNAAICGAQQLASKACRSGHHRRPSARLPVPSILWLRSGCAGIRQSNPIALARGGLVQTRSHFACARHGRSPPASCLRARGAPGRQHMAGLRHGSSGISSRLRPPQEVAAIKAKRQREHEDAVLAEADAIRARRVSVQ